jgi:hypothetical protein
MEVGWVKAEGGRTRRERGPQVLHPPPYPLLGRRGSIEISCESLRCSKTHMNGNPSAAFCRKSRRDVTLQIVNWQLSIERWSLEQADAR